MKEALLKTIMAAGVTGTWKCQGTVSAGSSGFLDVHPTNMNLGDRDRCRQIVQLQPKSRDQTASVPCLFGRKRHISRGREGAHDGKDGLPHQTSSSRRRVISAGVACTYCASILNNVGHAIPMGCAFRSQ